MKNIFFESFHSRILLSIREDRVISLYLVIFKDRTLKLFDVNVLIKFFFDCNWVSRYRNSSCLVLPYIFPIQFTNNELLSRRPSPLHIGGLYKLCRKLIFHEKKEAPVPYRPYNYHHHRSLFSVHRSSPHHKIVLW